MVSRKDKRERGRGPASPSAAPARNPDTLLEAAILIAFAATALIYLKLSPGTYQDDDLDHYFMARAAFQHPAFLIDSWGRPAFTILYALPAQLGFTAVRVMTILIALLTGWITGRTARRLGFRSPALVTGLTLWQPLFLILSFSALVEPLAALGLAALLYFMAAGRPGRAALVMGLLPVARLELAVLAPLVAVWLVRAPGGAPGAGGVARPARFRLLHLALLAAPLVAWALIGAVVHGDPAWMGNVIAGGTRPLTSTGPAHYFRNLISVTGPVVFLGLFLGAAVLATPGEGARPKQAGLFGLVLFVTLAALTWDRLPIGGSIGFLRHLIVLAPIGALLTAAGVEALTREMAPPRRALFLAAGIVCITVTALFLSHTLEADYIVHPEKDWTKLAGLMPVALVVLAGAIRPGLFGAGSLGRIALLFVVVSAAFCLVTRRPLSLNGEQVVVKASVDKLAEVGMLEGRWIANHPWFYHLAGRDRWDRAATPYTTRAALSAARPGDFVFWENHYGDRLYGDVPEEEMKRDPRFELVMDAASGDDVFRIAVYRKIAEN